MNWASYTLSFCLHALILVLLWFWPASPPLRLDAPPVMISLVEGAPGGNRAPSSILGAAGQPSSGPRDLAAPAPKADVAAPARNTPEAAPIKSAPRETPKDIAARKSDTKDAPTPRPKPDDSAALLAAKKEAEKKKEEERRETERKQREEERKKAEQKKKEEERKKDEEKKKENDRKQAEQKKKEEARKEKEKDSVAAALRDARRKASSRVESGDRGAAVEQALAQARKNAGGDGGGGGGEGDGPGGGGLNDVYLGQIMLAVRPNWSFASASRANLACVVHVVVDGNGGIVDAQVTRGSGNAQFDASAVNAVIRTGKAGLFPKPPSPEYGDVDLVFRLDELSRR